ncbi:PEP-CTERM sorting domain-containing protein [Paludisphaera mucosa]|uniref:PEP-CTERM sorting domain-containing protein n=1 Tax=Paludisphaera mucosa TaxID=3030827 RepID=A0ABT6F3Z6_9BACT|nr:PEP-CTERM sorting domain-containing protein [Paludisphaera mucosa]MDG3002158.1 PEP-CTERM sorting domain-containing protein [Paludisphaera mucosa]
MNWKNTIVAGVCALAWAAAAPEVSLASGLNLVSNGDFEQTTNGANLQLRAGFTQLVDWTVDTSVNGGGLSFVVAPGFSNTGATGQYGGFNIWSPATGSNNGFTDSPLGGNYIVADGAEGYHAAISQTITGLVAGDEYDVSFSWATGQQSGFDGETFNKYWDVSFGGVTQSTTLTNDVEHGFSGWFQTTLTFTATGASQVLSFLAQGQPNGVPPLMLLDGVSVTAAVPEPATVSMLVVGMAGLGGVAALRRRSR